MGGMTLGRTCVLLCLVLLSAVCGAKKLWGLDVGSKEDGEFETLLQRAAKQDGAGVGGMSDEVGQALKALGEIDFSDLSLSELCTNAIDAVLELLQDEKWLAEYADPGVLGSLIGNSGLSAFMGNEGLGSVEEQDIKDLLALEGSPILYKTKFYELVRGAISKLKQLKADVSDPLKLKTMVRDILKAAEFEEELINQVMELIDHPEVLTAQIKELLDNPVVFQELAKAFGAFNDAANMMEDVDLGGDEMAQLLEAMETDPEMMEEVYAELMKDPAFSEAMKADAGGGFFNTMGGVRQEGAQGQRQRVEL